MHEVQSKVRIEDLRVSTNTRDAELTMNATYTSRFSVRLRGEESDQDTYLTHIPRQATRKHGGLDYRGELLLLIRSRSLSPLTRPMRTVVVGRFALSATWRRISSTTHLDSA